MKKILYALAIMIISSTVFAMWASISLEKLVQRSDLIIIGKLTDVSEYLIKGIDHEIGKLKVDEVIWGNVKVGQNLELTWQNPSGLVCPRISHSYNQNKKLIWLLTYGKNNEVHANYPDRVLNIIKKDKVVEILKKFPVVLSASKRVFNSGEAANVSIIYRNGGNKDIWLPAIKYEKEKLFLNSKISLTVFDRTINSFSKVLPKKGKVVITDENQQVNLKAGKQQIIEIDFAKIYDLSWTGNYSIQISVKGQMKPSTLSIYISKKKGNRI